MKFKVGEKKSYSVSRIRGTENVGFSNDTTDRQITQEPNFHRDNIIRDGELKSDTFVNNGVTQLESQNKEECDFETAIKETKYGKYNWFLLSIGLWGYMSGMFSSSLMSLVLPSAGCDLGLTRIDKGILNAVVYIGMISTAFFGGIISDAFGRRFILVLGYGADVLFCILTGFSQSFTFLLIIRLFSGFVNSSLIAILTTLIAENHANQYRASVTIGLGIFVSFATMILPFLGWLIIPLPIRLTLFNGFIYLPSWKIFILSTSMPSILACISLMFADESPKFLMSQNKNDEALRVLRRIYSANTGNPGETYPVHILKAEPIDHPSKLKKGNITCKTLIETISEQIVLIFHKPYLLLTLLLSVMKFFTFISGHTLRLWSPELFALSIQYEDHYRNSDLVQTTSNICELLSLGIETNATQIEDDCRDFVVNKEVYFNAMITGLVTGIGYLISSYAVKKMDRKWLLIIAYSVSLVCCLTLYWSTSSFYLLVLISIFVAGTSSASTILSSVIIEIYPTFLRTSGLNLCLSFGRLGALTGNLVFPLLLNWLCASPFIFLAFSLSIVTGLTLLLPKTKGENLK